MKINLENTHSPCQRCFSYYNLNNETCQRCEYAIAIEILRSTCNLLSGSSCSYCKRYLEGCAAKSKEECYWTFDWERAIKDFIKE